MYLPNLCVAFSSIRWARVGSALRKSCINTCPRWSVWLLALAQRPSPSSTWTWGQMVMAVARIWTPRGHVSPWRWWPAVSPHMKSWCLAPPASSGECWRPRGWVFICFFFLRMDSACALFVWLWFMLQAPENNYMGNNYLKTRVQEKHEDPQEHVNNTPESWNVFCDFPEISHIAITGANVCISRQDNFAMVRTWTLCC